MGSRSATAPKTPGKATITVFNAPTRCIHQSMRSSIGMPCHASVPGTLAVFSAHANASSTLPSAPPAGPPKWWVRSLRPRGSASASTSRSGSMTCAARNKTAATSSSVIVAVGSGMRFTASILRDSAQPGVLEVGDDGVGEPPPRLVEVGVGAELAFRGDAAHGTRDELGDLCDAIGVDFQVCECVLARREPASSPRREFGRGARVERFEFGVVAWQGRAQVLDGSGVGGGQPVVEGVDDVGDALAQRCGGVGEGEHLGPSFGGGLEHRGPESVVVAELVLHRTPGGADVTGDLVGRYRTGIAGRQRLDRRLQHVLAGGMAAPVGAAFGHARVGHGSDGSGTSVSVAAVILSQYLL